MSSYHTSFDYLGKNSYNDFQLQIVHFESGDSGETDSYLSQEAVYADSPRGTRRTLYNTKFSDVARMDITVMKPSGDEFGIEKTREIYKWLTGATQYSWMDLYVGDEVKYRMLCFVQNVRPYKIDSRIVGFIITTESSSPWCFSPLQEISQMLTGEETLQINNLSDDMYTFTVMNTVFKNTSGNSLTIVNNTLGETTQVNNLVTNEVVTLSDNMMITSDKNTRVFGDDFNYVWPRLKSGINNFTITGKGNITFHYIYCIKVGDCVGSLNASSDPICNDSGDIILDQLNWNRISDTPNSLSGYGIQDAYTKAEVDQKIANVTVNNVYTKTEIDNNFYTKTEVDRLLAEATINIDETEFNNMLAEVLV